MTAGAPHVAAIVPEGQARDVEGGGRWIKLDTRTGNMRTVGCYFSRDQWPQHLDAVSSNACNIPPTPSIGQKRANRHASRLNVDFAAHIPGDVHQQRVGPGVASGCGKRLVFGACGREQTFPQIKPTRNGWVPVAIIYRRA